jgi:hypothetical protein
MKKNTYFLPILCAFFFLSSCETSHYIQSNKLTTYTASTTIKARQKLMVVMYGNADWDKFYKRAAADFKEMVEKEHEISVVYKIWTPLSFDTQADIDQAIKAQKPDFIIEIQQGQTKKTPVAVPITENIATTAEIQETNFLLTLKSYEVNQVFWKASTVVNRSAVGYVLGNRLFNQLKKDGIIYGGQLSMQ